MAMAFLGLTAVSALGALEIEESFDMTAGNLNGQAAGTGLTNNWTASSAAVAIPATLSYGALANYGGQALHYLPHLSPRRLLVSPRLT